MTTSFGDGKSARFLNRPRYPNMTDKTLVFVVSYGRPLFLWNCLDSLYRHTRTPSRIVLVNNWHPDPMVETVIRAFEMRGLLDTVYRFATNSVDNIRSVYDALLPGLGESHVFLESDAVIQPSHHCWLAEMLRIHREAPQIGMLGSLIDTDDFVPQSVCSAIQASGMDNVDFLAKLMSPERGFRDDASWQASDRDFFYTEPPCPITNPPGRLLMLNTETMKKIGLRTDGDLAAQFRLHGMRPAVTPRVRHRHLSLLNIFDYDTYSSDQRNNFFEAMREVRISPTDSGRLPVAQPGPA